MVPGAFFIGGMLLSVLMFRITHIPVTRAIWLIGFGILLSLFVMVC